MIHPAGRGCASERSAVSARSFRANFHTEPPHKVSVSLWQKGRRVESGHGQPLSREEVSGPPISYPVNIGSGYIARAIFMPVQ